MLPCLFPLLLYVSFLNNNWLKFLQSKSKTKVNKTKKILVIDDDEGILEGFKAILEENGYVVTTAINADSIFSLITSTSPNLILLDILLSGVDGLEICKKVKNDATLRHIPIIMISAHPKMKKEIKKSGADDFLAKPFEMNDLLKLVTKHIDTSQGIK